MSSAPRRDSRSDALDQQDLVASVWLLAIADRSLADMGGVSARHEGVLTELTEWWEDVSAGGIGSAVVLLAVPPDWGRSRLLDRLERVAAGADGPVTLTVRVGGVPAGGRAVQAQLLKQALAAPFTQSRVVKLLGLDSAAGEAQLGLDTVFEPVVADGGHALPS